MFTNSRTTTKIAALIGLVSLSNIE